MNNEELRQRLVNFLEQQPGYSRQDLVVDTGEQSIWRIIYGQDIQRGIAGLGETAEGAYEDFVTNWFRLKGEEWISNDHTISGKTFYDPKVAEDADDGGD